MNNSVAKTMIKILTLFCLTVISLNSYAALIFKFDNAEFPEVDFVGVQSSGVDIYFGADTFDIGESFDLLIGASPGASDFVSETHINLSVDGIPGFSFGGTLNLMPLSDPFFMTIIKKSGTFDVSGVTAYFTNNGNGANFHGVQQRPNNSVDVPEPTSLWLLLIALTLMWRVVIINTRHNV